MSDNVLTWLVTCFVLIAAIQGITVYSIVKLLGSGRAILERHEQDDRRGPMSVVRHP